ncbi:tRNA adenosine(34) deaminase TadA [Serpentinicella sp. ANB-PHB4]|uniref:tRNA adenosine(34) deaminase TadA n=1 Tax=Serpentinicella sp. ANB-PHB4 TaxID=3074076 RepID=UPI00285A84F9|nr:tRNA adenosine(34) deaminase TadA [Serpentinicella sp. ANB-PHB4]MDR5659097.1 tRNA adenosine(34) deaminase TadA [Serpentinicella sp. ANB-PHB4]
MVEEIYMRLALEEADKAYSKGEVPIGAIVVQGDRVIGSGHNLRECSKDSTAHAEIVAIRNACNTIGGWRLTESTLYVTIEPCPMCAGAILQSRIKKVVIGAMDSKGGACGSVVNLLNNNGFNHQTEIQSGVLEEMCADKMKSFFKELRSK